MDDPDSARSLYVTLAVCLGTYLLLLGLSAALAAFQVAVVSIRRARLAQLIEGGSEQARRTEALVDRPEPFLIASRIASAIAMAAATVLAAGSALAVDLLLRGSRLSHEPALDPAAAALRGLILPSLIGAIAGNLLFYLLGDVLPRAHAAHHEERVLLTWAGPMRLFTWLMSPVVWLLGRLGRPVAAIAGVPFASGLRGARSDEEIRVLVEGSAEEGTLEPEEKEMIHSIIRFTDTTVRQIMVPRIDMHVVDLNTPLPEVIDLILSGGHTRVPIFEETVDRIVGIVHAKDLLRPLLEGNAQISLKDISRAPYYVPEGKKVDELLHELRREQIQLAIVVDEYGGTSGLVTIEDIIEEIVGDIADEYDVEEPLVQTLGENGYLLDARLSIDDANQELQLDLPGEEYETIGGFVFGQLGRLPEVGEVVHHGDLDFIVHETDGRRILKIQMVRTDNPQQEPPTVAVA